MEESQFVRLLALSLFLRLILAAQCTFAQTQTTPSGEWILVSTILEHNLAERLNLKVEEDQLSGYLYRSEKLPLQGTLNGRDIRFSLKEANGTKSEYTGRLDGQTMEGNFSIIETSGNDTTGRWSASRVPRRPSPSPQRYEFVPTEFQREFSSAVKPVLRIWPGDTVHTTSVDAGGKDEHSVSRVLGGNPLTGPFYVEGSMPGDVLAVALKRLRLNRDWAESNKALVDRALTLDYRAKIKPDWAGVRWHLDLEKGTARLEKPSDSLKDLVVSIHPMLGCLGVAPGFGGASLATGDSGYLGGNMDFNQIAEGTTVYLPVSQPGALLYLGDAHALQGDGELNGDALETSMDIEFTVDVLREKQIGTPRAENNDHVMTIALSGSLDNAFREATSELASWLEEEHKLSSADVAVVLGTSNIISLKSLIETWESLPRSRKESWPC
jgi:acetamidase/formamidase